MYQQIIVPVDGSDLSRRAVWVAGTLADRLAARVVLVTVVGGREPLPDSGGLASIAEAAGIRDAQTRVLFDEDAGGCLAEFVASHPDSLVCCSTRGHGAVRQMVLGSVASRIVSDGGRPVLMVGTHHDQTRPPIGGPVLVSLDGSAFAEDAISVAIDWAEPWESPVLLAQVVSPIAEAPTAAARIPELFTDPDAYLPALASSLPETVTWIVVAHEEPARALLELVDQHHATLVVMATHGVTGIGRVALGSVASTVVSASPVPVLVVPPEGLAP